MRDEDRFRVLHALRLKTVAPISTVASFMGADQEPDGVETLLRELESEDEVRWRDGRRVKGWMLTDQGRAEHTSALERERTSLDEGHLGKVYDSFLALNGDVKGLCSNWQRLAPDDDGKRFETINQLEDLHERATVVAEEAAGIVRRLEVHRRRLDDAVEQLIDGDDRYFTSPTVDSYHTVWFEWHEDFLLTLGRDRAEEGSF